MSTPDNKPKTIQELLDMANNHHGPLTSLMVSQAIQSLVDDRTLRLNRDCCEDAIHEVFDRVVERGVTDVDVLALAKKYHWRRPIHDAMEYLMSLIRYEDEVP